MRLLDAHRASRRTPSTDNGGVYIILSVRARRGIVYLDCVYFYRHISHSCVPNTRKTTALRDSAHQMHRRRGEGGNRKYKQFDDTSADCAPGCFNRQMNVWFLALFRFVWIRLFGIIASGDQGALRSIWTKKKLRIGFFTQFCVRKWLSFLKSIFSVVLLQLAVYCHSNSCMWKLVDTSLDPHALLNSKLFEKWYRLAIVLHAFPFLQQTNNFDLHCIVFRAYKTVCYQHHRQYRFYAHNVQFEKKNEKQKKRPNKTKFIYAIEVATSWPNI